LNFFLAIPNFLRKFPENPVFYFLLYFSPHPSSIPGTPTEKNADLSMPGMPGMQTSLCIGNQQDILTVVSYACYHFLLSYKAKG
jgi:hypothetical protein